MYEVKNKLKHFFYKSNPHELKTYEQMNSKDNDKTSCVDQIHVN